MCEDWGGEVQGHFKQCLPNGAAKVGDLPSLSFSRRILGCLTGWGQRYLEWVQMGDFGDMAF